MSGISKECVRMEVRMLHEPVLRSVDAEEVWILSRGDVLQWHWILGLFVMAIGALVLQRRSPAAKKKLISLGPVEVSLESSSLVVQQEVKTEISTSSSYFPSLPQERLDSNSLCDNSAFKEDDEQCDVLCQISVPEWASSLLEPVGYNLVNRFKPQSSCSVCSSRMGPYFAQARKDVVKLWRSNKAVRRWRLPREQGPVSTVDVGDGVIGVGSGDGYLSVWDMGSGQCVRGMNQMGAINALKMVEPQTLGIGSESCVQVWDPRAMKKQRGSVQTGNVIRMESVGNEIYVRELKQLKEYDLRMFGGSRIVREIIIPRVEQEEIWCDAEQNLDLDDDDDDDDIADGDDDVQCCSSGGGDIGGRFLLSKCLAALWR